MERPKEDKTVEPEHLNSEMAIDFFIAQPLKVADRFMKKLYSDDEFYRTARYALVADAKELYLYGSARQVKKACISLMRQEEFAKEPPGKDDESTTLGREIIEAVVDEQNLLIRKLIENFINLINFQDTNKNEVYRIFLSAENLDLFLGKQKDFREFYDFTSGNVQSSIDTYFNRMKEDLKRLGVETLWFLNKDNLNKRKVPVFNSILSRYKRALPLATDDEKLVLGATYHRVFSMASLSLHSSIGNLPLDIDFDTVNANIGHISLLSQHIINRANRLMGFDDSEDIEKLMAKGSAAPDLMKKYKRKFEVGDLVLAGNDLSEIVEVKESQFGYTSYRVKFLTRPPLPELPEDWLPSEYITRLVAKNNIREFYHRNLEKSPRLEGVKLIMNQSDEFLFETTKKLFIDLDKHGILIPMFFKTKKKEERTDSSVCAE